MNGLRKSADADTAGELQPGVSFTNRYFIRVYNAKYRRERSLRYFYAKNLLLKDKTNDGTIGYHDVDKAAEKFFKKKL